MSELVQDKFVTGEARLVDAPIIKARNQVESDQNFELPTALFGLTVAGYLGFVGIMLATFAAPALAIPMVVFALIITAGFGVPTIWTRLANNRTKPLSMGQFHKDGIMTNTGRCTARDATIQMLILPALIVGWGLAVAIIVAVVA